jgi:UDP-N-acetylglucosamine:LPS N-acetylglucosamine transferase
MTAAPRPVVMISASIGAGHDGAAQEITRRLRAAGIPVQNHDFLDLLPAGWGATLRGGYARQLRYAPDSWGRLLAAMAGPRAGARATALSVHAAADRILAAVGPAPAAVVSTYPLASQVLGRLRRDGRLTVPAIAVMTDPSVHPLCVAPGVDAHLAPSTRTAADIHAVHDVPTAVVAPVVSPHFRAARRVADALDDRYRLRLPMAERLAVVVAGSWGVGDVEATARDIAATGLATPVVVCGRNERLRHRLQRGGRAVVLGWVDDMPALLRTADVVVHNAGGLSSLEALATGAPVISYRCLPGHGTANAASLAAQGLSPWPRTPGEFAVVLEHALDGDLRRRQADMYAMLAAQPDAAALIAAGEPVPATDLVGVTA